MSHFAGISAATQPNSLKPATIDICAKATEGNSLTPSQPSRSPQTHSQLEPKDEGNPGAIQLAVETVPTIESDKRLEHKAARKLTGFPQNTQK